MIQVAIGILTFRRPVPPAGRCLPELSVEVVQETIRENDDCERGGLNESTLPRSLLLILTKNWNQKSRNASASHEGDEVMILELVMWPFRRTRMRSSIVLANVLLHLMVVRMINN